MAANAGSIPHVFPSYRSEPKEYSSKQRVRCLLIGSALAAIAAIACYYCISRGMPMIDKATSQLQLVGGYSLYFMGMTLFLVSFAIASATACRVAYSKKCRERLEKQRATLSL